MSTNRERLEKLLALANGTNFAGEASTAKAKYEELLAKYGVDEEEKKIHEKWNLYKLNTYEDDDVPFHEAIDEFFKNRKVAGGFMIRRSRYLDGMISLYRTRLRDFGDEYESVRKDCFKKLRTFCQLAIDEFGYERCSMDTSKTYSSNWDAWNPMNPNYDLYGDPDVNYLMFIGDEEAELLGIKEGR